MTAAATAPMLDAILDDAERGGGPMTEGVIVRLAVSVLLGGAAAAGRRAVDVRAVCRRPRKRIRCTATGRYARLGAKSLEAFTLGYTAQATE
jgi:hypothetical protein